MAISSSRRSSTGAVATDRKTILVVDDDVELRSVLRLALEEEGYTYDSAGSGLAALQKVRERTPDLVILDLNMPRMGGEEFLYAWRAGEETHGAPVIVLTATTNALRPADLGVEAVFAKPFDVHDLLSQVRDLLALPSPAPAAPRGTDQTNEIRSLVVALVDAMTVVLVTAEQLAHTPNLPDDVRPLTTTALDAAHRSSALVRRLTHLTSPTP
jgi:CheY-like chemotaxis protein